jgi:hypothetical protein
VNGWDDWHGFPRWVSTSAGKRCRSAGWPLGLELYDSADEFLAEVFRDDATGKTTVTIMPGFSLDFDVAEWFVAKARERLL